MAYTCRLAMVDDCGAIAPLWQAFLAERVAVDPSMILKPDFDVERYLQRQLTRPHTHGWLLEWQTDGSSQVVGCLLIYLYDEAPPAGLPADLLADYALDNPFQPRRVGSVLGLYIQPDHRQVSAIQQLTAAALQMATTMQVTDIDLLVSAEQTGIHALLERGGFQRAAVQYTRHYDLSPDADRISLHPPHPELHLPNLPDAHALPLRHPDSHALIYDPQGNPVFLTPLTDSTGEPLRDGSGFPIYPQPLWDTQSSLPLFDAAGAVITCPPVYDERGQIVEYQGIPQFCPPVLHMTDGTLALQKTDDGHYCFHDVERDRNGQLVRSPDGAPVFKF